MNVFKSKKFNNLINTEALSKQILSLPIAEYLSINQIKYVTKTINEFYEKNKVVVTGGAGFIGSHLSEYLKKLSSSSYR